MNDQEWSDYCSNKAIGNTAGMALSMMVPLQVAAMMLMLRDPANYKARAK